MTIRDTFTMIVIAVSLCGCGRAGNPDAQAHKFMTYLKDGKHLAVQECLSKEMRQMATLMGGVTDQSLNPYYRSGRIADFSLEARERTEGAVRYAVSVTGSDGKKYADVLDMRLEDGKWRVSRF